MTRSVSDSVDVAIVGLGHAGLCVAAQLNRHGIRPTVFDPSTVGDPWRRRHDRLRLNTTASASAVPGFPPPEHIGRWPSGKQWADYLDSVALQLDLDHRRVAVDSVFPSGPGWIVRAGGIDHEADSVVIATGRDRIAKIPNWGGLDRFSGRLIHSSQFDAASDFDGLDVLVVGGGNSATEIAHLLTSHAGRVRISMRSRPLFVERERFGIALTKTARIASRLPPGFVDRAAPLYQRITMGDLEHIDLGPPTRTLSESLEHGSGPVVDSGFVDAARARRIDIVEPVVRLDGDEVVLSDDRRLSPDVVICATGYEPRLNDLLDDRFVGPSGWPLEQEPPFVAAAGLYFAGFGPVTLTSFMPDFAERSTTLAASIADRIENPDT